MKRSFIQALAAFLITLSFAALCIAAEQVEPRVAIDISNHPFKGPVNAPVTVVVFSDYL